MHSCLPGSLSATATTKLATEQSRAEPCLLKRQRPLHHESHCQRQQEEGAAAWEEALTSASDVSGVLQRGSGLASLALAR